MRLALSNSTAVTALLSQAAMRLSKVFGTSDTGFALDFSKSDALYTDQAMTAVEPGGKVGFMVDQSKGTTLGPELVTNGGFASDSAWTKGTGWVIGSGVATHSGASAGYLSQGGVVSGSWYSVEFDITATDGRSVELVSAFWEASVSKNSVGRHKVIVRAKSETLWLYANTAGSSVSIDNVSVRELSGRHGLQTNDGLRPLLGRAPKVVRNLLTRTEEFDNAAWTKGDTTITTNAVVSPDGGVSADKLTENATTAAHNTSQTIPVVNSSNYVLSAYLKAGEKSVAYVARGGNLTWAGVYVDLSNGTVLGSWAGATATVTPVGNGWYRVSLGAATASGTSGAIVIGFTNGAYNVAPTSYAGTVGQGIYIWGAQLEAGSTVTPYQRVGASNLDVIEPVIGGAAQRNLLTRTEEFSHAAWTYDAQRSNVTVGADGKIVLKNLQAPNVAYAAQSSSGVTLPYTSSMEFKAAEYRYAIMSVGGFGDGFWAAFDLQTGTVLTAPTAANTTASISLASDGYYRCTITTSNAISLKVLLFTASPDGTLTTAGNGTSGIYGRFPHLNLGSTATAYEKVGAYWEPAHSVPAYGFLRPDYVDDAVIVNLLSGFANGTYILAGRNGCWIETRGPSAGDFIFGGTSGGSASGISGILKTVGDLVGVFLTSKALSASEKAQVLAFYQGKGAGGELVEGPELVVNGTFDTNVDGWTLLDSTAGVVGGQFRITATSTNMARFYQTVTVLPGSTYVARGSATRVDANSTAAQFIVYETAPDVGGIGTIANSTGTGAFVSGAMALTASDSNITLLGRLLSVTAAGAQGDFDNLSVKRLLQKPLIATDSEIRNSFFGNNEPGAWYDPSDLTTLFQDSAGTTPVTAGGQSVGMIKDKSGRGNHLIQSATGNRPIYQTADGLHWLQFDGVDDFLQTSGNLDMSSTDKVTVIAGVHKASDAAAGIVAELGSSSANAFYFAAPENTSIRYSFLGRGNTVATTGQRAEINAYGAAPDTAVITALGDIAGDSNRIRRNGTDGVTAVGDQGTGNYGSYPLYVGRRGGASIPFNGRLYGLLISGATKTNQLPQGETYMGYKLGMNL